MLTRSEAEERFLALLREAGLRVPGTNVHFSGYEIDFLWRSEGVAVKVDGYGYHRSRPSFERDRRRITRLSAHGIQVISLTWRHVVDERLETAVRIAQALSHARKGGVGG